jgi:hypothetical protein
MKSQINKIMADKLSAELALNRAGELVRLQAAAARRAEEEANLSEAVELVFDWEIGRANVIIAEVSSRLLRDSHRESYRFEAMTLGACDVHLVSVSGADGEVKAYALNETSYAALHVARFFKAAGLSLELIPDQLDERACPAGSLRFAPGAYPSGNGVYRLHVGNGVVSPVFQVIIDEVEDGVALAKVA